MFLLRFGVLCSVPGSNRSTQVWRAVISVPETYWFTFFCSGEAASRVGRLNSFGASVEMAEI
jgi:hypothetical protein